MNFKKLLLILFIGLNVQTVFGQDTLDLTLKEALSIARKQSELAKSIRADYKSQIYDFKAVKASLYPQISINGTLPNYFRRINPITQPNGSVKLFSQSQLNADLTLNISQTILPTGGSVFITSGLSQYNIINEGYNYWQTSPLRIGISQPLTLFNATKWNYEQTKLRAKQATKSQIEALEDLNVQVTQAYFNLYVAKMQLKNAEQNVKTNDTLYQISKGRYKMGKIAENDLLQIDLQLMNARNSKAQNAVRVVTSTKKLRNLLGMTGKVEFDPAPVTNTPIFEVDVNKAVAEAEKNRSDILGFKIAENQAEMQLKRAQSEKFASGSISASFGLNQSGDTFKNAYYNPLNSQRINVSVSLPLVGWGKYRDQINSSKYHLKSTRQNLKYSKRNFKIQIENVVHQFKQLQSQLFISAKADTIAQKRYFVAKERYLLGKISITDLGLAQKDKDQALINYVMSLQQYWVAYYNLRRATLYDFSKDKELSY